jgi:hypothetical protein
MGPVTWAIVAAVLLVFAAVAYRVGHGCESSTVELENYLKVTLAGCPVPPPPPPDVCASAIKRSNIPMCGWWHVTTTSRLTGGRKPDQFTFNETLLPISRFEIGPYEGEVQLMQKYKGSVFLRDGTTVPALFDHYKWPTSKETDVDLERIDIQLPPGTIPNQPYLMSVGEYYDRDKKLFVLREMALTLHNIPGFRNEQIAYGLAPEASAIPLKK